MALIQALLQLKIPKWELIQLHKVPDNDETIKHFIENSLTKELPFLTFNLFASKVKEMDFYSNSILKTSHQITESITIWNYRVNQSQMGEIMKAFQHLKQKILLMAWVLDLQSVPDFTGCIEEAKWTSINLSGCGHARRGNWKDTSEFDNLICALSKSQQLKNRLNSIIMINNGLTMKQIMQILTKRGFKNVKEIIV